MSFLLDANALIALGWPPHEHHERMLKWFKRHASAGWSTTAFTQAAFVRVLLQPSFSPHPLAVSDVAGLLLRNTAHPGHSFLAMDFGFEEVLGCCTGGLVGHRQITDAYLLTTAIVHEVKLVTLDTGIAQLLATASEREQYLHRP
ncbi:MAG: TA system VapC family ribonuclease toxin [Burkholderiales bacterium]